MTQVTLREVGLRDGLQMVSQVLTASQKLKWCAAVADAGVPEIEVTSFVPAHVLPQFGDSREVATGALAQGKALISVLAVNLKGARLALDAGVTKISCIVSASEAHSVANVRRTTNAAIDEFERIVAARREVGGEETVQLSCAVATAFGCTLQGEVAQTRVMQIAEALVRAGADEILIADTVGYADPAYVRRIFRDLTSLLGDVSLAAHFHDTRGLGLANVTAALECGITRFDASLGGLGGCPFAPGATGNINLEDCAFLLEAMGLDTGIDIEALMEWRKVVEGWLTQEQFYGAVARAGLPRTFVPASQRS